MKVTVTTLEFTGGNSNKFYRIFYPIGNRSEVVGQWGSQNGGRAGGQNKAWPSSTGQEATREYSKRLNKLKGEGYVVDHAASGSFEVDDSADVPTLIREAQKLTSGAQSTGTQPKTATPKIPGHKIPAHTPGVVTPKGRMEDLNDRLLDILQIAAEDPRTAMERTFLVKHELDEVRLAIAAMESYVDTIDFLTEGAMNA